MPKHLCSQLRVTSVVCYPHTCPGASPKHQGPQDPASPRGSAWAADGPITDTSRPCSWPAPVARLSPASEGQVLAWVGLELPAGGSLAVGAGGRTAWQSVGSAGVRTGCSPEYPGRAGQAGQGLGHLTATTPP